MLKFSADVIDNTDKQRHIRLTCNNEDKRTVKNEIYLILRGLGGACHGQQSIGGSSYTDFIDDYACSVFCRA